MLNLEARGRAAVASLRGLPGVTTRPGVSLAELKRLEQRLGCHLPAAFRGVLLETNGLEVAHGFMRILGFGASAPIDIVAWNDPSTWKWAFHDWREEFNDHLILILQADGTADTCQRSDLQEPGSDPRLHVSVPGGGGPAPLQGTLVRFLEHGFKRIAREPGGDYDSDRLLKRFGMLPGDRLVAPSPLTYIDEDSDVDDLAKAALLPAAQAMIIMGDLERDLHRLRPGDHVIGVETWVDDLGHDRIRYRTRRDA